MIRYVLFACLLCLQPLTAGLEIDDSKDLATVKLEKHYALGAHAFEKKNWKEAAKQFRFVGRSLPTVPLVEEARFFEGVSFFRSAQYEEANDALNEYLKGSAAPRHFQEALEYKFLIADRLRRGAKCRLLGSRNLPKIASGQALAVEILDEVISAMPNQPLAAEALFAKGNILWRESNYRGSVEAFQLIIRRFSKHELALESYLLIERVYLDQAKVEVGNPDILAFSEINLKKFRQDFPKEERLADAENLYQEIKEVYASGLFNTARFYEKLSKPKSALLYYDNAIRQFPDTQVAENSRKSIDALLKKEPLGESK